MDEVQCDRKSVLNFMLRSYIGVCNLDSYRAMCAHEQQENALHRTFITNFNKVQPNIEVLPTGSKFEGLALPDVSMYSGALYPWKRRDQRLILSDLDFMFVDHSCPVALRLSDADSWSGIWFAAMDSRSCHAGYLRLVPASQQAKSMSVLHHGQQYINTTLFKQRTNKLTQIKDLFRAIKDDFEMLNKTETEFKQSNPYDHGPAITFSVPQDMGAIQTEIDVLGSLPVPQWPDAASEWTQRVRQHEWPPEHLRDQIISGGCHLVPVAHSTSDAPELEWRLSFSKSEKLLARSLNRVQRQCYLLLKILYYYELKTLGGIASYHLKTSLFWACERTPASFWQEGTTMDCLNYLLDTVIHFLVSGSLPNYFLPVNNMLDTVTKERKRGFLRKLCQIRKNPFQFILPYQCVYNTNLAEQKNVLQKLWADLKLKPYTSDTVYCHSPKLLDQVFQRCFDQLKVKNEIGGHDMIQCCLMLVAILPSVKSSNHVIPGSNENETLDFFVDAADIFSGMLKTKISFGDFVSYSAKYVLLSQNELSCKVHLAPGWEYFLRYALKSNLKLTECEKYHIKETLTLLMYIRTLIKRYVTEPSGLDKSNDTNFKEAVKELNILHRSPAKAICSMQFLSHANDITIATSYFEQLVNQLSTGDTTVSLVMPMLHYDAAESGVAPWANMLQFITHSRTSQIEIFQPLWDDAIIEVVELCGGQLQVQAFTLVQYMFARYLSNKGSTDRITQILSKSTTPHLELSNKASPYIYYLFGCVLYTSGFCTGASEYFMKAASCFKDVGTPFCRKLELLLELCELEIHHDFKQTDLSKVSRATTTGIGNGAISCMKIKHCDAVQEIDQLLQFLVKTPVDVCKQLLQEKCSKGADFGYHDAIICVSLGRLFWLYSRQDGPSQLYLEAAGRAFDMVESYLQEHKENVVLLSTYLTLFHFTSDNKAKVIAHSITATEQFRKAIENSTMPELITIHEFEMEMLPESLQKDLEENKVLYLPCILLQLHLLFITEPLVTMMYQHDAQGGTSNLFLLLLQRYMEADQQKYHKLSRATWELELKGHYALITGHLLKQINCVLQAREAYKVAARILPRYSKTAFKHIRDCEGQYLKLGVLGLVQGNQELTYASFQTIWQEGLPLCSDECSLGLHMSCGVYDIFGEAKAEHRGNCIRFVIYLLTEAGASLPQSHRAHLWMLVSCMYFQMYEKCEDGSKQSEHRNHCCDALDKALACYPSGALYTLYGNFLYLFKDFKAAAQRLEQAVVIGTEKHILHDHKAKARPHHLITDIHNYPAHCFVGAEPLFELFTASTPFRHYDFYIIYASYLLVRAKCKLGIPCDTDLVQFETTCADVGYCNGKWHLVGVAHLTNKSYANAELCFEKEITENKFFMDTKKFGLKMKVVSHCCQRAEIYSPEIVHELAESCVRILENCEVKLSTVSKHCYLTYTPVGEETLSEIIVLKLIPLMSLDSADASALFEELMEYVWNALRDEESTSGVAAAQLGMALYQRYQTMEDEDEKLAMSARIREYLKYGLMKKPLSETCLCYAMFRLEEENLDEEALTTAQKGLAIILEQLDELLSKDVRTETDERKLKFFSEKSLDKAIGLVLACCVLLGKADLAISEHERVMNMKQRQHPDTHIDHDMFVNILNGHSLNISQYTTDMNLIIAFQKAVLRAYPEASESAVASLSSNIACMMFSQAMSARAAGNTEEAEQSLLDTEHYFLTSLNMSGHGPAQVADCSNFYYKTGSYQKALSVIGGLELTDENKYHMNAYGHQEKPCVDAYIQAEIDSDDTGQGFLVNSHLYSAYVKVACLTSLDDHNQDEINVTTQHMATLCADDVIMSHTSFRLLGGACSLSGDRQGALKAFSASLDINPDDPLTRKYISECEQLL